MTDSEKSFVEAVSFVQLMDVEHARTLRESMHIHRHNREIVSVFETVALLRSGLQDLL